MHPLSVIVLIATLSLVMCDPTGVRVGGISAEEKPASDEVIKLVKELHEDLKTKIHEACVASKGADNSACSKCLELQPVSYKSQVVSGVNYFVKLVCADETNKRSYYHARIYHQSWTGTKEVSGVKGPVAEDTSITYF